MVPLSRLDFKAVLVGYNSTTTATFKTHWPLNRLELSMVSGKKKNYGNPLSPNIHNQILHTDIHT